MSELEVSEVFLEADPDRMRRFSEGGRRGQA